MILIESLPDDLMKGDITAHGVYIGWYGKTPEERTYEFAQTGDSTTTLKPPREINLALDPSIALAVIRSN